MKGVLEQPTLKEVKDIQIFLELANYYWWFIKDFVVIARPLYDIVKKYQKWEQTERQKVVFKERFTKELVLAAPDLDKKMRIEIDASNYVTGGVLSKKCENK